MANAAVATVNGSVASVLLHFHCTFRALATTPQAYSTPRMRLMLSAAVTTVQPRELPGSEVFIMPTESRHQLFRDAF